MPIDDKYRRDEEQAPSTLGQALKTGAVLGGAVLGYRNRHALAGGARRIGSFAGRGAGAGYEAISKRLLTNRELGESLGRYKRLALGVSDGLGPNTGLIRAGRNLANPQSTGFNSRFEQSIHRQVNQHIQKQLNPIEKDPTRISSYFHSNIHATKGNIQREAFEFIRERELKKDLKANMGSLHDQGLFQHIIENEKRKTLLNSPTEERAFAFLKEISNKETQKSPVAFRDEEHMKNSANELAEILGRYRSPRTESMKPFQEEMNKYVSNIEKIQAREFERAFMAENNKTLQSRLLERNGTRQVTFGEYKKLNLDNDNMKIPLPNAEFETINMIKKIEEEYGGKMDVNKLIVDKHLFIDKEGKLLDMRGTAESVNKGLSFTQDAFQIPFLRFNPLDLAHYGTIRNIKEQPGMSFLHSGELHGFVQHNLKTFGQTMDKKNMTSYVKPLERGGYMYAEGRLYDFTTGQLLDEGLYLGSSAFGPQSRMHKGMGNIKEREDKERGFFKTLFDLGNQQAESSLESFQAARAKFKDPMYGPNMQKTIAATIRDANKSDAEKMETIKEVYGRMYGSMEKNAMALSDEAMNLLAPEMNKGFKYGNMNVDMNNLHRPEDIMDALSEIVKATGSKATRDPKVYRGVNANKPDGIVGQLHETWSKYVKDPHTFLHAKDMEPDKSIVLPDMIAPIQLHEPRLIPNTERVKRMVQQYAIEQMEMGSPVNNVAERVVLGGIDMGILRKDDAKQLRQLTTLTDVRQFHDNIYSGIKGIEEGGLNEYAKAMIGNGKISDNVASVMEDIQPWYAGAPGELTGSVTRSNTTVYRKYKPYQQRLAEANAQIVSQGKYGALADVEKHGRAAADFFNELFLAGRKDMDKVTTMTALPYYYAERLDNAVSGLGLGLSQYHRGSFKQIVSQQFMRRIAMPYMAYQQAVWLDGQFGDAFSDGAADTYVNMHKDVAWLKDVTGINRAMSPWSKVFAGGDQIKEAPFIKQLDFLTFGAFSDWRSEEEVNKYYESGEDAIRRGRYWGVGSNTPWSGGVVEYFAPNWYRRMKSDYKFTDTMYGSEKEYWSNHWMPTLTNPLAPIKHFITDPYHYENKHKDDRPYAVTGGFSELEQLPLVGPLVNKVVGGILKPQQNHPGLAKAHREYIEEINQRTKEKIGGASNSQYVQVGVAGGINILEQPGAISVGGGSKTASGQAEDAEIELLASSDGDEGSFVVEGGTGTGGGGSITIRDMARSALTTQNRLSIAAGTPAYPISQYGKLINPDLPSKMSDLEYVDSWSGIGRDMFYSASEIGGMYGFLTKTAIGFEESGRGGAWAPSTLMTSYARSFWDLNLGGMGGQLSEIGRRYVPRDPNKDYYSPIQNDMPDWMPGSDYFIDLQHGDPYAKVMRGEMRMPGAAYESLYELHPDGTGTGKWANYGIFDRFRILADVAPYSTEFKEAKKLVSKMNQEGLLTESMIDEYGEIREQLSARKEKFRWYSRRFTNAEIKQQTVTVDKVIDANTFTTKENPQNPIKLAGVQIAKDDTEIADWLGQFIHEGAKLRIGVDADPLSRVKNDKMNTMRAVVYAPKGEEGMSFDNSIKGQSLNYIVANRNWSSGQKPTVRDDEGSVATYALYSSDMRFVGRQWERLTHDILPQLPIVGVFADKFLQVRSPIESYEREQVYGKSWRPWTEPWSGWMKPMLDTIASRNPIVAAAEGAGIGHLFAKKGPVGKNYKGRGRIIGAAIGAGLASYRVFEEQSRLLNGDDTIWLPDRRKKEREVNEYFDRLKYVKYRGLYERASRIAKQKEGIDVNDFFEQAREKGAANKGLRKYFHDKKKWLSIAQKSGYGDNEAIDSELEALATDISGVEADKHLVKAGSYTSLALQYRKEYESTLYGMDAQGAEIKDVLKALTPKDRKYFSAFMESTNQKERHRILKAVPGDMRRLLQAKWGMEVDKKESIGEYFKNHYIPDKNWEGWNANASLDDIKIRVMQNEGVELTESGYWADDVKRADMNGAKAIPMHSLSSKLDMNRLQEALRGAGLEDVRVTMEMQPNEVTAVNTVFNLAKDRTQDIVTGLNENLQSIMTQVIH